MFIFDFCTCPKCNGKSCFSADAELTLSEFEKYYEEGGLLVLSPDVPPKFPDYIMFTCNKCGHIEKFTDQQAISYVRTSLAKVAWATWQKQVSVAKEFDGHLTRYIYENGLGKFVTEKELLENPILKEYMRLVKRNDKS